MHAHDPWAEIMRDVRMCALAEENWQKNMRKREGAENNRVQHTYVQLPGQRKSIYVGFDASEVYGAMRFDCAGGGSSTSNVAHKCAGIRRFYDGY